MNVTICVEILASNMSRRLKMVHNIRCFHDLPKRFIKRSSNSVIVSQQLQSQYISSKSLESCEIPNNNRASLTKSSINLFLAKIYKIAFDFAESAQTFEQPTKHLECYIENEYCRARKL